MGERTSRSSATSAVKYWNHGRAMTVPGSAWTNARASAHSDGSCTGLSCPSRPHEDRRDEHHGEDDGHGGHGQRGDPREPASHTTGSQQRGDGRPQEERRQVPLPLPLGTPSTVAVNEA